MTNVVKKTKPEDGTGRDGTGRMAQGGWHGEGWHREDGTGRDDDFHQDGQGRPF